MANRENSAIIEARVVDSMIAAGRRVAAQAQVSGAVQRIDDSLRQLRTDLFLVGLLLSTKDLAETAIELDAEALNAELAYLTDIISRIAEDSRRPLGYKKFLGRPCRVCGSPTSSNTALVVDVEKATRDNVILICAVGHRDLFDASEDKT